jgi:hypothetical protein
MHQRNLAVGRETSVVRSLKRDDRDLDRAERIRHGIALDAVA